MVSWDQAVEPVGSNQNAGFMPVKNRVELVPACAWIHFSEDSKNLPAPGFEDGLVMHVQPICWMNRGFPFQPALQPQTSSLSLCSSPRPPLFF